MGGPLKQKVLSVLRGTKLIRSSGAEKKSLRPGLARAQKDNRGGIRRRIVLKGGTFSVKYEGRCTLSEEGSEGSRSSTCRGKHFPILPKGNCTGVRGEVIMRGPADKGPARSLFSPQRRKGEQYSSREKKNWDAKNARKEAA